MTTWSTEQLAVIQAPAPRRLVIEAGPGTGKTAVACARIAHLIEAGLSPSRILMISFTRTAVAEVRERVRAGAVAADVAAMVQVVTIDSFSYKLREGFESDEAKHAAGVLSFASNLERLAALLETGMDGLQSYISRFEHLLVDEAQDVIGVRATVVASLIDALSPECGVTVLGDPHQAIYGFTSDEDGGKTESPDGTLLEFLAKRTFDVLRLTQLFRTSEADTVHLFDSARTALDTPGKEPRAVYDAVRESIAGHTRGILHRADLSDVEAGQDNLLILYRRRADVALASSWLSSADRKGGPLPHRLRLGGVALPVAPWVAYLLGEWTSPFATEQELGALWTERAIHPIFAGVDQTSALQSLMRVGREGKVLSMERLRRALGRTNAPVELCASALGVRGPILSTIHASKGREAEIARIFLPRDKRSAPAAEARPDESTEIELDAADADASAPDWLEEARVLYVGATRGRQSVEVGEAFTRGARRLKSGRLYRLSRSRKGYTTSQIQVGIDGDVLPFVHATWPNAAEVQALLASLHGSVAPAHSAYSPEVNAHELFVTTGSREHRVGQFSPSLNGDLWEVSRQAGFARPAPRLRFFHILALGTIAVADPDQRRTLRAPYDRSGLILAPVLKGLAVPGNAPQAEDTVRGGRRWKNSR